MANTVAVQVTDAPARVAAPYGLFTAVTPAGLGSVRWENGLTWTDEQCGELPPNIVPNCPTPDNVPLTFTAGQAVGLALPFTVYGDFVCSPVSWTPESAQAAATQRLLAREEEATANQLVTFLTTGTDLIGDSIATSGDVSGDIALLEAHLAAEYGSQGVILTSLGALYGEAADRSLYRQGNGLYTMAGTPVAVVRTAPTSFSLGIIPAPLLVRGDPFASTEGANSAALLDRSQNDMYAAAFRSYVAGWTQDCGAAFIAPAP